MTYDEALAVFGTQANLARALGITQSTVSLWGKGPRGEKTFAIPPHYQYKLEIITSGALRADDNLRIPYVAPLRQQVADGDNSRQQGGYSGPERRRRAA